MKVRKLKIGRTFEIIAIMWLITLGIVAFRMHRIQSTKEKLLNELQSQIDKLVSTTCKGEHDFEDKIYMNEEETVYFTKCKNCDCIKKYSLLPETKVGKEDTNENK